MSDLTQLIESIEQLAATLNADKVKEWVTSIPKITYPVRVEYPVRVVNASDYNQAKHDLDAARSANSALCEALRFEMETSELFEMDRWPWHQFVDRHAWMKHRREQLAAILERAAGGKKGTK